MTLVNQNTETKNRYGDYLVALKGDTVQAVVNPYKDNLIYIWSYENANGGEENITTLTGNVYNTGDTAATASRTCLTNISSAW